MRWLRILFDLPRLIRILIREALEIGLRPAFLYTTDHVLRLVRGLPPRRFSQIRPGIHVGGQFSGRGLQGLLGRGITGIVNLRDEYDDRADGELPTRYLHLPTVDDEAPTLEDLCRGHRFILEELERKGAVYVHCMLGVGRSVTLIAAHLVCQGQEPEEALEEIRRVRPFIQPTPAQRERLEEFARLRPCCG